MCLFCSFLHFRMGSCSQYKQGTFYCFPISRRIVCLVEHLLRIQPCQRKQLLCILLLGNVSCRYFHFFSSETIQVYILNTYDSHVGTYITSQLRSLNSIQIIYTCMNYESKEFQKLSLLILLLDEKVISEPSELLSRPESIRRGIHVGLGIGQKPQN